MTSRTSVNSLCIQAVETNNIKLVRLLLKAGADIAALNSQALRYAAIFGHTEIVKLFEQYMEENTT